MRNIERMSWNLLIYKPAEDADDTIPLGTLAGVTAALSNAFPALEWDSEVAALVPGENGFLLDLNVGDGIVWDIYTNGGFNYLKELAALCKQEGWRIADAQEGEDVDLQDPDKWYQERGGE